MPASTPSVAVETASRPDERALFGTLADLPGRRHEARVAGPTLVLIGAVVALAAVREDAFSRTA
jgi:siroheme synthase